MTQAEFAYAWIAPCGHCNGVAVDNPKHPERSRKFISDMLRGGGHIERVPVAEARRRVEICDCEKDATVGKERKKRHG